MLTITALDDPRLAPYRDLRHSREVRESGLFVAEGEKPAQRLWESSFETVSVLLAERFVQRLAPILPENVPIYVVSDELIRETVGFNFHRGVLSCGRRRLTARLEDVVTSHDQPCRLVVCPAVNDAENLGGIIRSAAAFGVDALLIPDRSIDPFSRRVLRVSMGTVFKLPIVESTDLLADAHRLNQFRIATFATVLADDAEPLTSVSPPSRWALIFGAEGEGLSTAWISACERQGHDSHAARRRFIECLGRGGDLLASLHSNLRSVNRRLSPAPAFRAKKIVFAIDTEPETV
jgi:tRNA G18 (ribose-2'-O)-methylase SpoU